MNIEEHRAESASHTTFYLASGPANGPLIIFVHGWPELSISWRNQIPVFAGLGFRVIAPDMRGYGRSSVYAQHDQYALEHIVNDMLELLDQTGRKDAIWVGHDWGSAVVWSIASHHPEKCVAIASLCVPYLVIERGLDAAIALIDRDLYPEDQFPAGQFEYMRFYEENFAHATKEMEANVYNTLKLFFRKGNPGSLHKPAPTAFTRINKGWFGEAGEAPDLPLDEDIVTAEELTQYSQALQKNGFFGPNSWYMNHSANRNYTNQAVNDSYLDMPVLFLGAMYDDICQTYRSNLTAPMQQYCRHLTVKNIKSGHWMAQEKPSEVNALLANWISHSVSDSWPYHGE